MDGERIIAHVVRTAATVAPPENANNRELAQWVKKQKPGSRLKEPLFDKNTGIVYLEKGQKLTKWQLYRVPKLLSGQYVEKGRMTAENDPREDIEGNNRTLKKYYRVKPMGNGVFRIYRSDTHPFKQYDLDNVESMELDSFDDSAYFYDYYEPIEGKAGDRYVIVKPSGMDERHVLNQFENFFNVKYTPLKTFLEPDKDYSDYDPNTDIPSSLSKTDGSALTKDDIDIIQQWLEDRGYGKPMGMDGVVVELYAKPGKKMLTDDDFMMTMVR